MDKKFFQALENKGQKALAEMARRHDADSTEATALRWAISHSPRLYVLFDKMYNRPEPEFRDLRYQVLCRYMLGFGHAEE